MATPPPSYVRQNYHPDCEAAVNHQIQLELYVSYVYAAMALYFQRDDVALKHFAQFFLQQSNKEREHAQELIQLQNQRSGHTLLQEIDRPQREEWDSGLEAMETALRLAKRVNQGLLNLHQLATEKNDGHLCDFLQSHCLREQVKLIRELGGHITSLYKMGAPESGLAEYLFDKLTLGDTKKT